MIINGQEFDIERMIEKADPARLLDIAKALTRLVPILEREESRKLLARKLVEKEVKSLAERIAMIEKSIEGQDDDGESKKKWPSLSD